MHKYLFLILFPISLFSQDIQPLEMKGMIEAHNECRASLNLPPLIWSKKLAKKSLKWAKKLKRENQCLYNHSPKENRKNIGENISWNQGCSMKPRQVAEYWISEQEYFNFDTRICKEKADSCGHFTQIIWRDTKMVGCAMVRCGEEQVWVCQYEPAGNVFFKGKIMPAY